MRSRKRNPVRNRIAGLVLGAALALGGPSPPALADLIGLPAMPPDLTAPERELVAANPDLAELEGVNPWVVWQVLRTIDAARAGELVAEPDATPRGGLDGTGTEVLARNPALREVYRAAPDAAVDLLALIRAAGGKGRPTK